MSLHSVRQSSSTPHHSGDADAQFEPVQVLGETGGTVVYIFPSGGAIADRNQPDFETLQVPDDPANAGAKAQTPAAYLDALIAAGQLTETQKAVALYDHQSTGMEITDILVARGWA